MLTVPTDVALTCWQCRSLSPAVSRRLVKDRLGDPEGAVSVLHAAVTHYKKVHGEDGSTLIAKALTSLGRCKELTNQLKEAGDHFTEAVKIFEKRAGKGPLLAGALGHLGKNQLKQQKFDSATASLFSAVELEVRKDALDLNLIWELIEVRSTSLSPARRFPAMCTPTRAVVVLDQVRMPIGC